MKYLVDADVLSELTKPEPEPEPEPARRVVNWLRTHGADLVVSPIVLGELEFGILLLPAGRRRARLTEWFAQGIKQFNVVEIDAHTAGCWASLLADLKRKGRAMPIKDSLIAATARQHKLTIATRNVADYRHAGVSIVNPFKAS